MRQLLFASALSGCAHAGTSDRATADRATADAPAGAPTGSACPMTAFPQHVRALREAVLRNDASVVRSELAWMSASGALPSSLHVPTSPPEQSADAAAEQAHTASVFLGELGVVCNRCHAQGHPLALPPPSPPVAGTGVAPHMQRHLWAIDHLWDGLIGPSEIDWNQGVAVLAGSDLDPTLFAGRNDQDSPAGYIAPWIRRTGLEALRTADPAARGRMYGDLLATCADCHAGTLGAPDAEHPSPIP